jgi:hypothetical protein
MEFINLADSVSVRRVRLHHRPHRSQIQRPPLPPTLTPVVPRAPLATPTTALTSPLAHGREPPGIGVEVS